MLDQAQRINKAIIAAGVVWHECQDCGHPWPFPKGFEGTPDFMREWMCAVCVTALLAKLTRAIRS